MWTHRKWISIVWLVIRGQLITHPVLELVVFGSVNHQGDGVEYFTLILITEIRKHSLHCPLTTI